MLWFICTVIQLVLWWMTFFKSKKMTRGKVESRWSGDVWGKFVVSNERYKFTLGLVLVMFLLCLVPILGSVSIVVFIWSVSNLKDSDFEDERPSFAIVELFKKKI